MGTWNEHNFGNDCACDYRATVIDDLLKEATPPKYAEDIDLVMAAVEMILAICKSCGVPGHLARFDVDDLRRKVLRVFDDRFGGETRNSDYVQKRRKVIDRTLRKLHALLAKAFEDGIWVQVGKKRL